VGNPQEERFDRRLRGNDLFELSWVVVCWARIPAEDMSVIAEGAILLVKSVINRGQQKGGRG
jgi:hypothetical protein